MGNLLRLSSSPVTGNVLLLVDALLLAAATFVESRFDSGTARMLVYNNPAFYLLQLLLAVNFFMVVWKHGYLRRSKAGMLLFHGAFLLILTGAWITHRFGFEGVLHLREGERSSRMLSQENFLTYDLETPSGRVSGAIPFSHALWRRFFFERLSLPETTLTFRQMGPAVSLGDGEEAVRLLVAAGDAREAVVLYGSASAVTDSVSFSLPGVSGSLRYGKRWLELPFQVELTDFRLERYPGSRSPSSYESDLIVTSRGGSRPEELYMNRVVHEQGYRLYQSSYDTDERGSVLSVNNDYWGTLVTYVGYGVLGAGILWILLGPGSRFRQLNRRLKGLSAAAKGGALLGIFLLFPASGLANPERMESYVPSPEHAERFGRLPVQSPAGRIEPMNTYTRKLLRKLCRDDRFHGFSADQVVVGMQAFPSVWSQVPLIRQTDSELHALLGTLGPRAVAFGELFDAQGRYKLARRVEAAYHKPPQERSRLDKEILKLDEKVNIFYALQQGRLLSLFPLAGDAGGKWYARGDDLSGFAAEDSLFVSSIFDWYLTEVVDGARTGVFAPADSVLQMVAAYQRARASVLPDAGRMEGELLYNRLSVFDWAAKGYLATGLVLLLVSLLRMLRGGRLWCRVGTVLSGAVVLLFLYHTFGIGLRWYISEQAPWSNGYESMVYVGWASALAGLLFLRRSVLTTALATFLAGLVLFVAHLNWMDPEITPLVPVLKSYWLMIHVAVVTGSYGFFGMSFLLGLTALSFRAAEVGGLRGDWRHRIAELRIINELSLTVGLCMMTAGTFLGAIWANESWGRYWGWDPKETWALITVLVYALVLHARFIPRLRGDVVFSLLSVYALLSVLMTYFGVNYYLTGLHSYGKSDTPPALGAVAIVYGTITLLALWVGRRSRRRR